MSSQSYRSLVGGVFNQVDHIYVKLSSVKDGKEARSVNSWRLLTLHPSSLSHSSQRFRGRRSGPSNIYPERNLTVDAEARAIFDSFSYRNARRELYIHISLYLSRVHLLRLTLCLSFSAFNFAVPPPAPSAGSVSVRRCSLLSLGFSHCCSPAGRREFGEHWRHLQGLLGNVGLSKIQFKNTLKT